MGWQEYQQKAADFFRSLGLSAEVEAKVEGARGVHKIDVYVEGTYHGIKFRWLIECKAWKSNVSKEKVMALASIIQDIGADRGFLLSEEGFQSGAIRSAQKTNITLTSLADLAETAEQEAMDAALGGMNWSLQKARNRLRTIKKEIYDDEYYPPMMEPLGELMILEQVLEEAHSMGFPLMYRSGDEIKNLDQLLKRSEDVITTAEKWEPPKKG